jgi:hypothetical protein
MADKNEDALAGKHPDMGIHGIEGQNNEGHVKGSKQSEFNEHAAQERQKSEDDNELNRKDARDDAKDPGRV